MAGLMTVGNDPGWDRSHGASAGPSAYLRRRLIADVQHSADLAELVDVTPRRWTDRLLAEARFHLAGMINAIELAIGMGVADPQIEALLSDLGPGYCRQAIERELGLLSPEFLGHLRRRAAIAMLLRRADVMRPRGALPALEQQVLEQPDADALTAFTMAEQRWCAPMRLDVAMQPDLPAEPFHDLAWSVAALLIQGCEHRMDAADPAIVKVIAQATEGLIARHDEGQGAIAQARRLARAVPQGLRVSFAAAALADARLLLFAALVERETGLLIEPMIDALLDQDDTPRHAILRLMRIDDATAFHTAELFAPLTGAADGGDEALAQFVEAYRLHDLAQAERWRGAMTQPRALADKLAMMGSPR